MKNIFMMAVICIAATACNRGAMPSITPVINAQIKNEQGNTILAGHCAVAILQTDPYKEWFDRSYNNYTIDSSTVHIMQPYLTNKTVEIFLGSWCGDSKREVPRMIKILQAASFDTANIKLIFVDNSTATYKQSPQHEEAGKNIHHVPTIIVYSHGKETGRIIESPKVSLEKDMLAILLHKSYTPNYESIAWWMQHVPQKAGVMSDAALQPAVNTLKPVCKSMREFNAYGYVLLAQKNYAEALNVFRLNTLLFPTMAAAYSSLGEAYNTTGNKEYAKKSFQKVLQLKPGDETATKMLVELN
jgi:tetratricopeptide (TPR) repeat protein